MPTVRSPRKPAKPPKKQFVTTWRNKWLTAEAKSLDGMIRALEGAAGLLKAMKAAGVKLERNSAMEDDHATLTTTDPKVAKKFRFDEESEDEDDFE